MNQTLFKNTKSMVLTVNDGKPDQCWPSPNPFETEVQRQLAREIGNTHSQHGHKHAETAGGAEANANHQPHK